LNILNNIESNNVREKVTKLINLCKQHGQDPSLLNAQEKKIIEPIKKNFGKNFITIISLLPSNNTTLAKLNLQDPLTDQAISAYGNFFDLTKPALDLFVNQLSSFDQRSKFLNILNNIEDKNSVSQKAPKLINLCLKHSQDLSLSNDEEKKIIEAANSPLIEAIKKNFGKDFITIISLLPGSNITLAKLNLQDPLTDQAISSYGKFFDLTKPALDLFVNQLSSFDQRSKFLNILNNIEGNKGIAEKVAKLINLCIKHGQDLSLSNDEEKKIIEAANPPLIEAIEKNFGKDFITIISLLPSAPTLAKLNLQDPLTGQPISSYANFFTAEKANATKEKKASEIQAAQAIKDFILNLDEKLFKLPVQDFKGA
jgi:phosphotransferase system HPr-like phosphotransfer protein